MVKKSEDEEMKEMKEIFKELRMSKKYIVWNFNMIS
jgi:hypothetical protein